MSLNAVIIDDEVNNIDNLQQLLKVYYPTINIVDTAGSVEEGVEAISEKKPNLVFLDIQMPGKNGFDLLTQINQRDFEVIFVTAYEQYAIQAMRFSAIDYLLKPINVDDLIGAIERAVKSIEIKMNNKRVENLIHFLKWQQNKEEHRIALVTNKETRFVKPEEIIRCESSNNYTRIFISDGTQLLVSRPIFQFEEMLTGYGFVRCHQSHLVNKIYVRSWIREDGEFLLIKNGEQVPISRNKKEVVKEALMS
ncbi:MAG: response regulator transcription factor [Chitinophagaceae bacterium]|nr:response regulator transcription factor [Chitinophagaceae bacterium]